MFFRGIGIPNSIFGIWFVKFVHLTKFRQNMAPLGAFHFT